MCALVISIWASKQPQEMGGVGYIIITLSKGCQFYSLLSKWQGTYHKRQRFGYLPFRALISFPYHSNYQALQSTSVQIEHNAWGFQVKKPDIKK